MGWISRPLIPLGARGQRESRDPDSTEPSCAKAPSQTVGAMPHEFGHALGLPDLDHNGPADDSAGIGRWGLMGWGAQGWHGDGPNPFCAWSLQQLEWIGLDNERLDFWALNAGYAISRAGNLGDTTDTFDGIRYKTLGVDSNPSTDRGGALLATTISPDASRRGALTTPPHCGPVPAATAVRKPAARRTRASP